MRLARVRPSLAVAVVAAVAVSSPGGALSFSLAGGAAAAAPRSRGLLRPSACGVGVGLAQRRCGTALRAHEEEEEGGMRGGYQRQTPLRQESQEDTSSGLPRPRIGDVVAYPGKWKGEDALGEIRNIQYIESRRQWLADVLPLKSVGDGQYQRSRGGMRATAPEDVSILRPVRAFYVRSSDAFKVLTKANTGEIALRAEAYDLEDFALPVKTIDPVVAQKTLEEYEALKKRLLLDTMIFGALGMVGAGLAAGWQEGLVYGLGALSAGGYVLLLERNADALGAQAGGGFMKKVANNSRFALPVLLAVSLAAANRALNPEEQVCLPRPSVRLDSFVRAPSSSLALTFPALQLQLFRLVPKEQFAAAMAGFMLSYRVPLFYREVLQNLKTEDVADMIPGSLAKGVNLIRGGKLKDEAGTAAVSSNVLAPVVVVSGPSALNVGTSALVRAVMAEDDRLVAPVWVTSRPKRENEVDGVDAIFLDPARVELIQKRGEFLTSYEEPSGDVTGLRAEELKEPASRGKIIIVDADRSMTEALLKASGIALIGVWVSMDSIEQVEARVRSVIEQEGGEASEMDVRSRVRRVVDDIEFGVTSGVYEFTVIEDGRNPQEALPKMMEVGTQKVRSAISFAAEIMPSGRLSAS
jgi:guanylate kinase